MATLWKTLKVFICSTFQDLELARDKLARVFYNIEKDILDRQVVIRPYDLRWRERHPNDPVVQWCIEMVKQCQYFVGILGSRYGWRPPEKEDNIANDERLSITEMEIRTALQNVAREKRFFCFGSVDPQGETQEDLNSLEQLKQSLQENGEKIFHYETVDELTSIVENQFQQIIDAEFPPGEKVLPLVKTCHDAIQEIVNEKVIGFIGRKNYLSYLEKFIQKTQRPNYLCCYGMAGTGKSTLMAKFVQQCNAKDIPVVVHFTNMAGNAREVYRVLANIGEQLHSLGKIKKLATTPSKLQLQIQQTLQKSGHLVLILDGLDDIVDGDLQWLPQGLPPEVRVILTTRPVDTWENIQKFSNVEMCEILPMDHKEVSAIIEEHCQRYNVHLKNSEKDLLQVRAEGNPLYLKIALDEIMATGAAVEQLAKNINLLFEQIIERLALQYGKELVNDYLGFIATGRTGAIEKDLKDLLGTNDSLLFSLHKALRHFLISRSGFIVFFHQEFVRTIKMLLGKVEMRRYSSLWCDYFFDKGYQYIRTLEELPYQLQLANRHNELLKTLVDLQFLEMKVKAGKVIELCEDLTLALRDSTTPRTSGNETKAILKKLLRSPIMSLAKDIELQLPGVVVNRELLSLLLRILKINSGFLLHYPKDLWQCLWNLGYWHDGEETSKHQTTTSKISQLITYWQKNSSPLQKKWLRSLHPLPLQLDSPLKQTLSGHEDSVNSICFSPDGKNIVSGSNDNTIQIWDIRSGFSVHSLLGHENSVHGVCFHPTENKIASCSRDKTICIWDAQNGTLLQKLHGHKNLVSDVCFSPDGKNIASSSWDNTIRIWDVETGQTTATLHGHNNRVYSVSYSNDGRTLASGSYDKKICLWDIETQKEIHCLSDHWGAVYSVNFSPDDKLLVSGSYDKTVCVWSVQSGELLHTFMGHRWAVHSVCFSKDGKQIISASEDKTIRSWNISDKNACDIICRHSASIQEICFSPDGLNIVSCGNDKAISLWELKSHTQSNSQHEHSHTVQNSCLSYDEAKIASGAWDKTVIIWNVHNAQILQKLTHSERVNKVCFSPDNVHLAVVCWSDVYIWNTATGHLIHCLQKHKGPVHSVCFSPNGKIIATGSWDKHICLWNNESGDLLHVLRGHSGIVEDLSFSPDNKTLASASEDTSLRLWNVTTGELIHHLQHHKRWVSSVCFNSTGTMIASGSWDKTICVWDKEAGSLLHVFQEHQDIIDSIRFHENPDLLISRANDQVTKIWSLSQQCCIKTLPFCSDINAIAKSFPYYVGIKNKKTLVTDVESQETIAVFPSPIKNVSLSSTNVLSGYAGNYVYLMKIESTK